MMKVEKIASMEAATKLKSRWNRLLEKSATQTVELSCEWQLTHWKHFPDNAELFILAVWDREALAAVAPLKLVRSRRFGLPVRVLQFIASDESNYQDFIVDPDIPGALATILDYLVSHKHAWDMLHLVHIPSSSPTLGALAALDTPALRYKPLEVKPCLYLPVDRSWEAYAADTEKMRTKAAYRTRKLHRQGDVHLFHCEDEALFTTHMQHFFELHCQRWNPTPTPSQFNQERSRRFYLEIVSQLLPKKQIDLFCATVDGNPAAYIFSFWFWKNGAPESALIQLLVYSDDYARASPSIVLHEQFVEEIFQAGDFKFIDFGDYFSYKEMWADQPKTKTDAALYVDRPYTRALDRLSDAWRRLRRWLKRSPVIVKTVRTMEAWAAALRRRGRGDES